MERVSDGRARHSKGPLSSHIAEHHIVVYTVHTSEDLTRQGQRNMSDYVQLDIPSIMLLCMHLRVKATSQSFFLVLEDDSQYAFLLCRLYLPSSSLILLSR